MVEKLSKKRINELLSARFESDICTKLSTIPHPSCLKDIDKATKKIKKIVDSGATIGIVGDYDVDGIVSLLVLSEFFDHLNIPYISKIPNRFKDGYGLNEEIIKGLNVPLIITVDNGISAHDAASYCKENGICLIITDHHTPPETLPKAYAIINPKQDSCDFPFSEICGAQVAWYLVAALKQEFDTEYNMAESLDLLAIAIMADMMDLLDMNRAMVKSGINYLNNSKRAAFKVIKEFFKKDSFESDDISFLIAPLLNSSGRMDDAMLSYRFLKSKTENEALELLEEIVHFNTLRKEEEQKLFEKSENEIKESDKAIVVWGEDWHEGVIGIVASRLARKYNKPSFVFSIEDGVAKGSARGIGDIDILNLLVKSSDFLKSYGGHTGAAGMRLDSKDLPAFKNRLNSICNLNVDEDFLDSELLGEIDPEIIDFELLELLEYYEPYGQKNPKPSFLIKSAIVKINRVIGREKNHLKLILETKTKTLESVYFNFDKEVENGEKIDIIFTVVKNSYRGLVTPQLHIKQILSYK